MGRHGEETASSPLAWVQMLAYLAGIAAAALYTVKTCSRTLRQDSQLISDGNALLIRMAYFAVLYIGVADAILSFMRVEGFLPADARLDAPGVQYPVAVIAVVAVITVIVVMYKMFCTRNSS